MLRRLPPISTLNALVAVARHQSFTKAAMALNVTQSAVSHQIKLIEDLWGVKLFERRGHGIVATDAGRRLAELTGDFFDRIGHTLDELRVVSTHEKLRIDTLQSFAVKWLVPRLRRFDELYPNVDVWISTHDQLVDFAANSIDIAIYSSGSVLAQRLIFGHTPAGDLTPRISQFFDATIGPKRSAESYRHIASELNLPPNELLFLSDVHAELLAASAAGFKTLLCVRPGNPEPPREGETAIESFDDIP